MAAPTIAKLVIVGVGLIGGSFALALKHAGTLGAVVGVGRSQANLDAARRLSIVERTFRLDENWTAELADADLVLLATPVVRMLDPARHDAIFAAVSHLPHALAFALVAELAARRDAADYFRYAASGFRDFTRLASSHPEMWRDICVANSEALRHELAAYR